MLIPIIKDMSGAIGHTFILETSAGMEDERYYPSRILGFVSINGSTEAVIWCSEKPLRWTDVEFNFFCTISLGQIFDVLVVTVPLSALVHPLCVIPDYGSDDNSFIVVLPKRNWESLLWR